MGKDIFSSEERSRIMSKISQKDTRPEILLRQQLHKAGLRFRKNVKNLPGTPDIVLPKHKTVLFIHGCFWHRHDCRKGKSVPSTRREFWLNKFQQNQKRDEENYHKLKDLGWKILVVWECEHSKMDKVVERVLTELELR